jgi:hypothetical protein
VTWFLRYLDAGCQEPTHLEELLADHFANMARYNALDPGFVYSDGLWDNIYTHPPTYLHRGEEGGAGGAAMEGGGFELSTRGERGKAASHHAANELDEEEEESNQGGV